VTAQQMIHTSFFGRKGGELFPGGLDDICPECGSGGAPLTESFSNSPIIEHSVPALHGDGTTRRR